MYILKFVLTVNRKIQTIIYKEIILKFKYIITILFILILPSKLMAADFDPELGMDPFYSSLNPEQVEGEVNKYDTLVDLLKNKKSKKKDNKSKVIKYENKADENKSEAEVIKKQENTEKTQNEENKQTTVTEKKVLPGILPEEKNNKKEKEEKFITRKYKDNASLARALDRDEREKERQKEKAEQKLSGEQKFNIKGLWPFNKTKKAKIDSNIDNKEPDIEFTADYMEYFPDRYEVEAVGNAKIELKKSKLSLSANKIVFNYDRNILRANENVVLVSSGSVTEGDFIKLDLTKPEGWIETPVTVNDDIKLSAKEAFLYSDRIEEYDGVAKVLTNDTISFGATSFASYVDQSGIFSRQFKINNTSSETGVYSIKAKTIYIDSKDEHEVVTIKNADLYLKNHKIATIPTTRIVSNKEHSSLDTNMPEFGSISNLGMHFGPAVVLNVPGGSTLKLAPLITYGDNDFGIGGIARFRNHYNMTEVAYGTSKDELLIKGRQKIAPGLMLNYSRLTNQSEWFLGYRKPKYSVALDYTRNDYIRDLKLHFSQRYSMGFFKDYVSDKSNNYLPEEGRFRWMTQSFKPVYSYENKEGNVSFKAGLVAQTAATVYTSGDVSGIFRIGPALNSRIGPWGQSMIFYQSAIAGDTPFYFDKYRYGRSNFVIIESLRLCKYLSVGYLSSLAMNRDMPGSDLIQENRLLLAVGPDYAKFTIGYDAIRHNTMFNISMLVGTKNSDIAFEKSVINNPDKLGREKTKNKKTKKKNYKKYKNPKVPIES